MSPARKFWLVVFVLSGAWPLALLVYATRPRGKRS